MTAFASLPQRGGRIDYRKRDGTLWGVEEFAIRRGADGLRVLTVHCEMKTGEDDVVRDTILSVDAHWHPVDASVRIMNHGALTGTGWFRFTETLAECESWSTAAGRVSQTMAIEKPMRGFGVHALIADGWMAATFPFERGAGHVQHWRHNLIHSLHHLGATGPYIHTSKTGFRYLGDEDVEVPAGRFSCRRLQFVGMTNDHPPYDMWVSADGDCLYIKGVVEGYMDSVFELAELEGGALA